MSESSSAPKARNVKAWGNAPGEGTAILEALKARNGKRPERQVNTGSPYFAPSALGARSNLSWAVGPGYYISRFGAESRGV